MAGNDDINKIIEKIYSATDRRRDAGIALCKFYAGKALKEFRTRQAEQAYWQNRTFVAYDTVFSDAIMGEENDIGWYIAHQVEYGVYLEKANNGRHAALAFIRDAFAPQFYKDLKQIYAG